MESKHDFSQFNIMAITGRVYTRDMVLDRAMSRPLRKTLEVSREEVCAVLDDETWMRWRAGQVPSSVAREALFEAFFRRGNKLRTDDVGDA